MIVIMICRILHHDFLDYPFLLIFLEISKIINYVLLLAVYLVVERGVYHSRNILNLIRIIDMKWYVKDGFR